MNIRSFWFLLLVGLSCQTYKQKVVDQKNQEPIAQYVVNVFQDSNGNMWFGSLERGVAHYNGQEFKYFSKEDGLPSNRVVGILEDSSGNMWFGTGEGLSKFDGQLFTNYASADGLGSNMINSLLIDRKGRFWLGTWGGVYLFKDGVMTRFPLPQTEVTTVINEDTKDWITVLYEDSEGNLWFGRDGLGLCRYDGKDFYAVTTVDGLNSNHIQSIQQGVDDNWWISTRVGERDLPDPSMKNGEGGLNFFDGNTYTQFPQHEGLYQSDVYEIYLDDRDHLWFSTLDHGVYEYDLNKWVNHALPKTAMTMLKDNKGRMWFGCAGGLYRLDGDQPVHVSRSGPW